MNKNREIIAHCFLWDLKSITKEIDNFKECGYSSIQISPIQPCKDGNEWWCDYQPLSFTIGNRHGTKEDLNELTTEAHKRGIKIICDVVLRHTAGTNDGKLVPHEKVDKKLTSNPYFWTNAENTTDYKDRWKSTHMAFGMPMLNYYNFDLQDIYIEFLQELKDLGCDGFRVDMSKHFITKEEDDSCYFWERVFGRFGGMFLLYHDSLSI
jgi:glycosidase